MRYIIYNYAGKGIEKVVSTENKTTINAIYNELQRVGIIDTSKIKLPYYLENAQIEILSF